MNLVFHKLSSPGIKDAYFSAMMQNNTLNTNKQIIVVYAPNGTGKTSLTSILSGSSGTSMEADYNGSAITNVQDTFTIIRDQNLRHIISADDNTFLMSTSIRREYELRDTLESTFRELLQNTLHTLLSNEFNLKATHKGISLITNEDLRKRVRAIVHTTVKGRFDQTTQYHDFVDLVNVMRQDISAIKEPLFGADLEKCRFLLSDHNSAKPIFKMIQSLTVDSCSSNQGIKNYERNDIALRFISEHYTKNKNTHAECIICETKDINFSQISVKKKSENELTIRSLPPRTQELLNRIVNSEISNGDPFKIKEKVYKALRTGRITPINELIAEYEATIQMFNQRLAGIFATCLDGLNIEEMLTEYDQLVSSTPTIDDDCLGLIDEIVNSHMHHKVHVERLPEERHRIVLKIDDTNLLNTDRRELPLSTGEQNFVSLAFELIMAKNNPAPVIVMDDPVSSYDSIYKNKTIFLIQYVLATMKDKTLLILTHSLDVIRLLDCQRQNSYCLYTMNNVLSGENNGFIQIQDAEIKMLTYISELLNLFRSNYDEFLYLGDDMSAEERRKLFLCAMVPYMRGFAKTMNLKIAGNNIHVQLTHLMHSYMTGVIDLSEIYKAVFGVAGDSCQVCAQDIMGTLPSANPHLKIVDPTRYPLLNKTLVHTLHYLVLRMKVEAALISKYNIPDGKSDMLTSTINYAYRGNDATIKERRRFFMGRKTLLNEFNHYESDLCIYLPAIDISDETLKEEYDLIISRLNNGDY